MTPISRRSLLLGALGIGAAGAGLVLSRSDDRPTALVYRGPASSEGCPEAVGRLLEAQSFRVVYCGPDEEVDVSAESLAGAQVYAQPGGGSLRPAWRHTRDYAPALRDFVSAGGNYLGFCLGAYLAGDDPGYALFPGQVRQYIGTAGATITDTKSTVVGVDWRGDSRSLYFQDGASFTVPDDDWSAVGGEVLARYRNGAVAAVVAPHGRGRIGLVGPHPEADASWYRAAGLRSPAGDNFDLAHDLIGATLAR